MKIAYLAPELPALSATFVYNEILALEKLGARVVPFSVHRPTGFFKDEAVNRIKQKAVPLYDIKFYRLFKSHFRLLRQKPRQYVGTFLQLLTDMVKVGFNRNSLGLGYRFFYAAALADGLSQYRCTHLHVHFAHVPTDIAMYASKMSDVGFSVTSHANDLFERGWLLKEKVERSCFFATISEFNKRFLAEQKVDLAKIKLIRCGVDLTQFATRRWVTLRTPVRIGVVGRLVEKKGFDTLIKAVNILRKRDVQVMLTLAGSGPLENELKTLVTALGLDDHVVMMGALPHSEIFDYINSLDMFVLPCKKDQYGDMDGIPVVLMEAMLAGVPVISTQISGIPELVVDGVTGYCIEQCDENNLAEAIERAIVHRKEARQMSKQAVSLVKDTFSLVGNTTLLNKLISSCSE